MIHGQDAHATIKEYMNIYPGHDNRMHPEIAPSNPVEAEIQRNDDLTGMPKADCPMLFVIELGEESLSWTIVSRSRKKNRPMHRGGVELGYGDIDSLSQWFEHFWDAAGDYDHEIHLVVTGPETLERTFVIPAVPKSELAVVVKSQAKKVYPLNIEKGLFGWKVIGKVERATGEKYQIYSLLLGDHWYDWLKKIFGTCMNCVTLITSSGQQFETLLNETESKFKSEDSYLIRLKSNVVETGFFHNGYLEFFREVPVDSLSDDGTVAELRRIVGIEEQAAEDSEPDRDLVVNELRSIIVDALDYYQGQFGQRRINSAYLCMPGIFSDPVTDFVQSTFGTDVVNLCDKERVAAHCKLAGVETASYSYSSWATTFPKRKIGRNLLNLVPETIKSRKKEIGRFRCSWMGLALVLITISVLSGVKMVTTNSINERLLEYRAMIADVESSPTLSTLTERKMWIDELTESYSQIYSESRSSFKAPLQILSHQSADVVRLNSVTIDYGSSGESTVEIEGEVIGAVDRQEAVLYMYLSNIENHPAVREFELTSKGTSTQFGVKKTSFSLRLVVRS